MPLGLEHMTTIRSTNIITAALGNHSSSSGAGPNGNLSALFKAPSLSNSSAFTLQKKCVFAWAAHGVLTLKKTKENHEKSSCQFTLTAAGGPVFAEQCHNDNANQTLFAVEHPEAEAHFEATQAGVEALESEQRSLVVGLC